LSWALPETGAPTWGGGAFRAKAAISFNIWKFMVQPETRLIDVKQASIGFFLTSLSAKKAQT
jgi:hypothetical protein